MSADKPTNGSKPEDICLACGLCCDGTIFADLKLQPGDSTAPFALLESPPSTHEGQQPTGSSAAIAEAFSRPGRATKIRQPCIAFDGCRCRIYPQRPKHCREFECLLLHGLKAGRVEKPAALEIIRTARQRADKVWRLLRELGDVDEESALSVRFRHTAKRLESGRLDEETADRYGELTLAVHDLNCLLSSAFYTG